MELLLVVAILFGLTAIFGLINERFLRLQPTIGLMLLALSLPDIPEKALIVNMTFGVVAVSILVQGSTISKLFSPADLKGSMK